MPEAVEDTGRLINFLQEKNPEAAVRAAQALQKGTNTLSTFPELGHSMNDGTERREFFIPFGAGSYVLRYIISEQTLVIVRVWHSRENRK
ncbi:plasmid stabilization system protein [Gloeobacter kilaueensis JS1]|uniref:Plasmid stabilization system protein n=1 Tax=Gloeobacter kilaueensis (strain ATCC BAA-2537 / CCAP 1431/1 / ULC 316 / JS1) TaxID=1183438 RepID=U5QNB8_GLOK1|nr:plasmid stabilization system protein [Gloeobacter kilaueensis JS1]